ncbi:uncharacterized protein Z520_09639 [Fonsecaea multimorphosa CBS 102226]|uniref:Amidase domain-containing protein n=1 Tax=Fonsecaea multimorphosa CBS 102226 TaxID=1442371 RepID=A0A0D2KCZ0_9EURO|nr:uncharacterized protein Z520_09639 [Fonsecaea multimorphosa CBS 102226]KIX94593.1 hypothetical protein Z520_09639 [Fonsecaea multimorphosa CBS 102226]
MDASLRELTIARAHKGYRDGTFTARQVVEYYLQRIKTIDQADNGPKLNSILAISSIAIAEADALDTHLKSTSELKGPLHGIPVVVKDQASTKGLATTYGSILAKDYVPEQDATLITRLKAAGAIILAKTTMPDFATSWHSTSSLSGTTKNPYDTKRDPGGSSSGTGAAVAADLGLLGVGEDTGGSIRVPSSFCGLVGIRVTPGIISRAGFSPLLVPQDTPGPMCRTVTDAALMLDILAGFDEQDPYTAAAVIAGPPTGGSYAANLSADKIKSARIGVLRDVFGPESSPDSQAVNKVITGALQTLQDNGTVLVDVEIPNLMKLLEITFTYHQRSRSDLDDFFSRHPFLKTNTKEIYDSKKYHPALDLFEGIATGIGTPQEDPDFTARLLAREELQRAITVTLAKHNLDALAFPDVQIPAPLLEDVLSQRWPAADFPTNTLVSSQSLFPSVTVPAGLTQGGSGLPVGLELVSLPYREQKLLELAYGVEQLVQGRKPPVL